MEIGVKSVKLPPNFNDNPLEVSFSKEDFRGESVLSGWIANLLGESFGELRSSRLGEPLGEFDNEAPKAPNCGGFFNGGRPFKLPAFLLRDGDPPRGGKGP